MRESGGPGYPGANGKIGRQGSDGGAGFFHRQGDDYRYLGRNREGNRERGELCIMRVGCDIPPQPGTHPREKPGTVRLPLLGEISASSVSLPVFTVIITCLDSFNPCTFFVLLFLLSLLLHTHSRKRMSNPTCSITCSFRQRCSPCLCQQPHLSL